MAEAREKVRQDAVRVGLGDDQLSFEDGGQGALAYADSS